MLYLAVQLAARETVATHTLDELLASSPEELEDEEVVDEETMTIGAVCKLLQADWLIGRRVNVADFREDAPGIA